MINRKTKQIREVNLILEQRYLKEQVTAAPVTPPIPAAAAPVITTTTTVKKMSDTELKNLPVCSGFNTEGYIKTEEGGYYIFTSPNPKKQNDSKPSRCKKLKQ